MAPQAIIFLSPVRLHSDIHIWNLICFRTTHPPVPKPTLYALIRSSCQDPACQATVTSDRAGLGRLWIGLGFRFPRSAHLLFSPTFHTVHTTRVPSRKTSFHCVHAFGHNLAFCMFIPSDPTFNFRTSLLFYSDARSYFIVPEVHLFVYLLSCSVLSFYSF